MPPNHLILLLSSIFPTVRVFSNESAVCKVLELQHQSFQWIFRVEFFQAWLVWSPCCPRDSEESSPRPRFRWISSSALSFLYSPTLMSIHDHWKNHSSDFVGKVMSLLFNMLSRLVITFLPKSKHLLISWLQSPSTVILEPPQNKVCHYFHCFLIYLPWSDGTRCHDLSFLNADF